jgi:hypothetical protein
MRVQHVSHFAVNQNPKLGEKGSVNREVDSAAKMLQVGFEPGLS